MLGAHPSPPSASAAGFSVFGTPDASLTAAKTPDFSPPGSPLRRAFFGLLECGLAPCCADADWNDVRCTVAAGKSAYESRGVDLACSAATPVGNSFTDLR